MAGEHGHKDRKVGMFKRLWNTFRPKHEHASSRHIVVLVEEDVYCPVTYVRLVNHLQHAPAGWTSEIYVLPRESETANKRLKHASLVLMARCVSTEALQLASRASAASIPVVYDIDDYLWRLPGYLDARDSQLAIDEIIKHANLVTTPSGKLRKFLEDRILGVAVTEIPNAGDLPMPESPGRELTAVMANSDFFRLAGSKQALFEAMRDAARAAECRVWLYYLSNDPPEYCTDDPNVQIIWCGVRAYTSYRALLQKVKPDLAIVPLPEDHFSCYKSVVKFAEFGAHGAAGIFSDVEPYKGFVRHGEDGWLSGNSPDEWRRSFELVFRMSPEELRAVKVRAKERTEDEFAASGVRDTFFRALESVGGRLSAVAPGGSVLPEPRNFTFREAYDYIVGVWRRSPDHRKA